MRTLAARPILERRRVTAWEGDAPPGRAREEGDMPLSVFSRRRQAPTEPLLSADQRAAVPRPLHAVAEALAAHRDPTPACAVAGSTLAGDGVSLGEAMAALRTTYSTLQLGEPAFSATEALALAWSEETLDFLGDVSCEDPLTGLASGAHLRARLAEVYREAALTDGTPRTTHALLVVDLADRDDGDDRDDRDDSTPGRDPFAQALCLAGAAEMVREGFGGGETLARIGRDKVVALVRRETHLGPTVARLHARLAAAGLTSRPRLWIEGLPDDPDAAVLVVSGLALL